MYRKIFNDKWYLVDIIKHTNEYSNFLTIYLRKFIECNIYRNNNADLDFHLVSLFLAIDQSHGSMRLILTSFVKRLHILFIF